MEKDIATKYYVLDFQFDTKEKAEKFIEFVSQFDEDKHYKDLLYEIYKVFKDNLDLSYIKPEFDYLQIRQIVKGLINNVDVSKYAKIEFTSLQMYQIREGLEASVNINVYARPEFNSEKMRKLKTILLS